MGKGDKGADRIEEAAASVAGDLLEVLDVLGKVADRAGPGMRRRDQDRLRAAIDRLDACHRLLAAELDRPEPDRRFMRLGIKAGAVAGSLALGFVGGELSERYDLQVPIVSAQEAAAHAEEVDRTAGDPVEYGWVVTQEGGIWWKALASAQYEVEAHVLRSATAIQVLLEIHSGPQVSPTFHARWMGEAGEDGRSSVQLVRDAIEFAAGHAPAEFRREILEARIINFDDASLRNVTIY